MPDSKPQRKASRTKATKKPVKRKAMTTAKRKAGAAKRKATTAAKRKTTTAKAKAKAAGSRAKGKATTAKAKATTAKRKATTAAKRKATTAKRKSATTKRKASPVGKSKSTATAKRKTAGAAKRKTGRTAKRKAGSKASGKAGALADGGGSRSSARSARRPVGLPRDVLRSFEDGQRAALEAVRRFVDTVEDAIPNPAGGSQRGQEIADSALEMAERLVQTQYELVRKVVQSAGKTLGDSVKRS